MAAFYTNCIVVCPMNCGSSVYEHTHVKNNRFRNETYEKWEVQVDNNSI